MSNHLDNLGEAGKAALTSPNGAVLMVCTIVGTALSVYANLFRGPLPNAIGSIALAGWIFGIVLILYLAGRGTGEKGTFVRLLVGVKHARNGGLLRWYLL